MSYDPPSPTKWYYTHTFDKEYKEMYDKGYNDAKEGKEYTEPHKPSNHERDTTYEDELNYWYYSGYYSYENFDTKQ